MANSWNPERPRNAQEEREMEAAKVKERKRQESIERTEQYSRDLKALREARRAGNREAESEVIKRMARS